MEEHIVHLILSYIIIKFYVWNSYFSVSYFFLILFQNGPKPNVRTTYNDF